MLSFVIGLIVLIVDIWTIAKAWGSRISTTANVPWTFLIVIFPIMGVILFAIFGRILGRKTTTV